MNLNIITRIYSLAAKPRSRGDEPFDFPDKQIWSRKTPLTRG